MKKTNYIVIAMLCSLLGGMAISRPVAATTNVAFDCVVGDSVTMNLGMNLDLDIPNELWDFIDTMLSTMNPLCTDPDVEAAVDDLLDAINTGISIKLAVSEMGDIDLPGGEEGETVSMVNGTLSAKAGSMTAFGDINDAVEEVLGDVAVLMNAVGMLPGGAHPCGTATQAEIDAAVASLLGEIPDFSDYEDLVGIGLWTENLTLDDLMAMFMSTTSMPLFPWDALPWVEIPQQILVIPSEWDDFAELYDYAELYWAAMALMMMGSEEPDLPMTEFASIDAFLKAAGIELEMKDRHIQIGVDAAKQNLTNTWIAENFNITDMIVGDMIGTVFTEAPSALKAALYIGWNSKGILDAVKVVVDFGFEIDIMSAMAMMGSQTTLPPQEIGMTMSMTVADPEADVPSDNSMTDVDPGSDGSDGGMDIPGIPLEFLLGALGAASLLVIKRRK
jgi:hypothetical protein